MFIRQAQDHVVVEGLRFLQSVAFQASAEVLAAAALALFIALIVLAVFLSRRGGADGHDGLEAEARRWIVARIDEHVGFLAEAYGAADSHSDVDQVPSGFATAIESFIAEVLLRQRDRVDVDLSMAIREFVVLHRAELYEDVANRTRQYLAAA